MNKNNKYEAKKTRDNQVFPLVFVWIKVKKLKNLHNLLVQHLKIKNEWTSVCVCAFMDVTEGGKFEGKNKTVQNLVPV